MNRAVLVFSVAVLASVAVVGCKKQEPAVVAPPVAIEPAPLPAPAALPTPAASASVVSVDLGNAVGADLRVATPMTSFGKADTIIAAVTTATSDPMASVPGTLGAKWTFQDGQVVNEENKSITFTGNGVTDFQISKPDGWPAGKYTLTVSLNGASVQTREFEVK